MSIYSNSQVPAPGSVPIGYNMSLDHVSVYPGAKLGPVVFSPMGSPWVNRVAVDAAGRLGIAAQIVENTTEAARFFVENMFAAVPPM